MNYRHLLSAAVGCVLVISKQATSLPVTTSSISSPNNSSTLDSTTDCDAQCLHELLPLMARQGAASGMWKTLQAYNAVDWCNDHDKCTPLIEEEVDHIADNIVKILPSHIYSTCDNLCVYQAGKNVTAFAMASSITWLSNILGRTSLVGKQGEATDSVAKLQWLRWQLGMEHNNFTFDYNVLTTPNAQKGSLSSGSRLAVRSRLAERGAKDIWTSLGQHWIRLVDKIRSTFSKFWQKVFLSRGAGQQKETTAGGKESPWEVPDVVSPVEVTDLVLKGEVQQMLDEISRSTSPEEEARVRLERERIYTVDAVVNQVAAEAKTGEVDWKMFKGPRHGRGARELGLTKEYAVANRKAGLAQPWSDGKGPSLEIMGDNYGRIYLEADLPSGGGPPIDSPTEEDSRPVQTIEVSSNDDASSIKSEALRDAFQKLKASHTGLVDNDLTRSLNPSEVDLRVELRDYNVPGTRYLTAPTSPINEISDDRSSQVSPKTVFQDRLSDLPPPPENAQLQPGGPDQKPEQPIEGPSEPVKNAKGSSGSAQNGHDGHDGPPANSGPLAKPGSDLHSNPSESQVDLNKLKPVDTAHNEPFTHGNTGSHGTSPSGDPGLPKPIELPESPMPKPNFERPPIPVEPIRPKPPIRPIRFEPIRPLRLLRPIPP